MSTKERVMQSEQQSAEMSQETPHANQVEEKTTQQMTQEIAELLGGKESPYSEHEDDSDDDNFDQTQEFDVKDLQTLAKKLRVDPSKLYDLEIPLGGETDNKIKLGELKDRYASTHGLETEQLRLNERKIEIERELMQGRRELVEIMSNLPKNVLTPELFKIVQTQMQGKRTREMSALQNVIPDWKDATKYESDMSGIDNFLSGYGLSRAWLESMMDHRLVKMVRDQWARAEHVKKVLERVKPAEKRKESQTTGKHPGRRPRGNRGRQPGRHTAQATQQVAALLRGESPE